MKFFYALLVLLLAVQPLAATARKKSSAPSDKFTVAEEVDLARRVIAAGGSMVFIPYSHSSFSLSEKANNKGGFEIGEITWMERTDIWTDNMKLSAISTAAPVIAYGGTGIIQAMSGINKIGNKYKFASLPGLMMFKAGPAEKGYGYYVDRIGPIEFGLDERVLHNRHVAKSPTVGTFHVEYINSILSVGKQTINRPEYWTGYRPETVGYLCRQGTNDCQAMTQEVSRRVEASSYEIGKFSMTKGHSARAQFTYRQSPFHVSFPGGKIYVTDGIKTDLTQAFGWDSPKCGKRTHDEERNSDYYECPLTFIDYQRIAGGAEILAYTKDRLRKAGWPADLVDKIEYMPFTANR